MHAIGIDLGEYACPHCHRALELAETRWRGWVLCPECGLPGLPPARLRPSRPAEVPAPSAAEPEASSPPTTDESPGARAAELALSDPRPATASSAAALILRTGLAVSLLLLLFAYLERSVLNAIIFGALTGLFAIILLWRSRG